MTLKIEMHRRGNVTILRLIGRVRSEHLHELERLMNASASNVALDLQEVTLVDCEVVHFLGSCAARAIPLMGCPPYIAEWIANEQQAKD